MKVNVLLFCLAMLPLLVSCKIGYAHKTYTSTRTTSTINDDEYTHTLINQNGREECSYTFKTKGYAYAVKSTGPLLISNGTVQKLRDGQAVHLVVTEEGRDYPYTITNGLTGIRIDVAEGTLTETDEARIKEALLGVEKQINGRQADIRAAQKQMEANQRQLQATQAQMQRQADALQKQAEAFQRQAQKQAEAMQKQAEALQKQAEKMQRQFEKESQWR